MRKSRSSVFFTLLSVVLVLCMLGIYGIVSLHTGNLTNILKENMNIIVELSSDSEATTVMDELKKVQEVKAGSVRFVDKAAALEMMNVELGEQYLFDSSDNPFTDVVLFNVKYQFVEAEELDKIVEIIKAIDGVEDVSYYSSVYTYLKSNVRRLSNILLIIGLILSIFAFALIYSTMQLSLYGERFKIRTMELVGASWNQIRKPFVTQSIRLALQASFWAIGILVLLLVLASFQFQHFWDVISIPSVLLVLLLLIVFSFGITQLASYIVVNKYLGASKSRFYQ